MLREYTKLERLKNYNIRVEFKNEDCIDKIQMLIFLNDELAYATNRNTFEIKEYDDVRIKLNRFYFPKAIPTRFSRLAWINTKENKNRPYVRYSNWVKSFRICTKIHEQVLEEMDRFTKIIEEEITA